MVFVGCITSHQHPDCISRTDLPRQCYCTKTEISDHDCYFTQSQYTDTRHSGVSGRIYKLWVLTKFTFKVTISNPACPTLADSGVTARYTSSVFELADELEIAAYGEVERSADAAVLLKCLWHPEKEPLDELSSLNKLCPCCRKL